MLERFLEKPPNPEMGDYAIPCFSFAKVFKAPPVKIAEELIELLRNYLTSNKFLTSAKAVGAYINFEISVVALAEFILPEKKREVRIKKLAQVYYISQNELFKDLEKSL